MATVTKKGQITLPKRVRDALGLVPGSQVEFEIQPRGVVMRRRVPTEAFDRWQGYLRGKLGARRTDELMDELRGEPLEDPVAER